MKRTALILLTAIYLLPNLGLTVNSFYCRGVLQSTTVFQEPKLHTDCKMASNMKGCCKTQKQYFKLKDQHLCAPGFNFDTKLFATISIPYFTTHVGLNNQEPQIVSYYSHAPPNWLNASTYILNCTYRI